MRLTPFPILQLFRISLLALALSACGGPTSTPSTVPTSANPIPTAVGDANSALDSSSSIDVDGSGIDQTKLNVCTMLPRADVEAAIGALSKAPQPTIPIGNEVGCTYVTDQARAYAVSVYNLDRWELFTKGMDGESVAGIGDGGWMVKGFEGSHTLYVLLRNRAVVGVDVAGADTPQFRKLVDVALAAVPLQ